jgi:hypothetical protein
MTNILFLRKPEKSTELLKKSLDRAPFFVV